MQVWVDQALKPQVEMNHLVTKKKIFFLNSIWLNCYMCIHSNEGECCKNPMLVSCLLEVNNLNERDS